MNNIIKKACFTGYRPNKFSFKLNLHDQKYNTLITSLSKTLIELIENGCTVFYCGMAEGFDIIAAECILSLKRKYKNIRLIAVLPFLEHSFSVKAQWKNRYNKVLSKSDEVVYPTTEYHVSAFQIRNIYMVDHSDAVITWYDGQKGGTRNTLKYATSKNKNIININFDFYEEFAFKQNKIDIYD